MRAFWREYCGGWVLREALDDWWVADDDKNPTWDLIAVCEGDNRRGLLLVEAKLMSQSWTERVNARSVLRPTAPQARTNDGRIRAAIGEAQDWFA